MPEPIEVRKVPIRHVSDASGLAELIDGGAIEADRVVAVIGKTEGNGGVNDYTRIIADRAFREVLVDKGSRPAEDVSPDPDRVVRRDGRRAVAARDGLRHDPARPGARHGRAASDGRASR